MKTTVISLGGSLIVPDKIDSRFLKEFKKVISQHIKKGNRVILVCGGGSTARKYQRAACSLNRLSQKDVDWVGIRATWLNAHLVKSAFKNIAYNEIIKDPNEKVNFKKVLIAGGWKPGFSTDTDAVFLAKTYGADTVINMSNIEYVYTRDPRKYSDAKPRTQLKWKEMRSIVGSKWIPGANLPFDPIAAKKAAGIKLKVIIIGKSISNLKNLLENKKFKGTVIE